MRKLFYIIGTVVLLMSCSPYKGLPKLYPKQYKIIDFVFPPEVDSVLTHYLSLKELREKKEYLWMIVGGNCSDDYDYSIKIYKEVYHKVSKKYLKKIYINHFDTSYVLVGSDYSFIAARTNRYAIINKGEFIIPVISYWDVKFMGYGSVTYPLDKITDWRILEIKVKGWDVVAVEYNP